MSLAEIKEAKLKSMVFPKDKATIKEFSPTPPVYI